MKSKKKITIVICSVLIVLLVAFACMMIISDTPASKGSIIFKGEVNVEDGVPSPASETKKFIVEEDGKYYWIYDWMGEPGMITGMSIKDADGVSVFACTAEGCYAESEPMELKAGTYEVEVVYLTNDEDMRAFLADNGITEVGTELYNYAENGNWSTEYTVGLESASATSILFKMALILGVVIGLLVVVIILAVTKTGDDTKNQFDERQELVRGKGFKYGFFTMMIANAALLVLNILEIPLFSNMEVAMTASIVIGISVFASYCIWNDGYFALNENRKSLLIMFGLIGASNLVIGIGNIFAGVIMENGAFTFRSTNLFCALMFIVVFVAMLAKHIKDGKEE
ncbi:MAG: hypothetical protein IJZ42_07380 [Lachnospiraceae bacterium]|nr:hypothetical protein [Lachnospiraceae bacterium]